MLRRIKRRVHKRRGSAAGDDVPERPSWEHESSGRGHSRRGERRSMRWMLGGGVALFGLVVGGWWVAVHGDGRGKGVVAPGPGPLVTPVPDAAEAAAEAALPALMKRSVPSILAEIEPLAKKFLAAKSIDDLLPLLHNPQRAKPRLLRQYPQGSIVPPGLAQFNTSGNLAFGDGSVSVDIRTRNFDSRQLTFVETPAGLKIDWECWAGWSDLTWPALLATRPTQATVFRVIVKRVDYYNFGFSDDARWLSYRLESLDGEHMIFGYVERGTEVAGKIHLSSEVDHAPMILKIRFPADVAGSNNQVVIDEVVANGWVETDQ